MHHYINGSDLLLTIGGKAIGHCTTHKLTYSTESKDRKYKKAATTPSTPSNLFTEKKAATLSISISAEGLHFYNETEGGVEAISALWGKGTSVEVRAFQRSPQKGVTPNPYLVGRFIITQLEQDAPAADDATYTVTLESAEQPSLMHFTDTAPYTLITTDDGTPITTDGGTLIEKD